jgi:hypothetical protein
MICKFFRQGTCGAVDMIIGYNRSSAGPGVSCQSIAVALIVAGWLLTVLFFKSTAKLVPHWKVIVFARARHEAVNVVASTQKGSGRKMYDRRHIVRLP